VRNLQSGSATRHSWDYKNPTAAQFMTTSTRGNVDQGPYGNQLAATLDDYLVDVPHAGDNTEDQWRLGQLRMDRHALETKCFQGEGNVRDFCPGQFFSLTGHPEIDTHPVDERDFVITELELTALNNLPADLAARGERLSTLDRRRRRRGRAAKQEMDDVGQQGLMHLRFTAVRRGVPIVPAFDPRNDLPRPQLQSAVVVGPEGEEVHCDAYGRVKIRFPGMRAADHTHAHGSGASGTPADSAWVRLASNWAGNGPGSQQQCGALTLPRVGTEVLVLFLGGDPDKPVIVSQVYNLHGVPPAFSSQGELPGNRYYSGIRSREVGGQRGNQVRFDDTRGQISAQIASDHGNSELNLGWLTHPRANGAGEPRGEGAELRSDEAVAVRGAKGLLLTADPAPEAAGSQLARAGLVGLADMLNEMACVVGKLAEQHAGDETTVLLTGLADKLRYWEKGSNVADGPGGGAPIVAVTAPAGIVVGSPDSVAIGSEKKVDVTSAGDAAITTGKHLFLRAARSISAFAHTLGIKFVAARGNVNLQTHQGDIEIKSAGRIRLVAAGGIDLHAPTVSVVAEGAKTDWANQTIVHQSAGQHITKAAAFVHIGPSGGTPVSPETTARWRASSPRTRT
jgi:type VI secretion system secreted protein VgrG